MCLRKSDRMSIFNDPLSIECRISRSSVLTDAPKTRPLPYASLVAKFYV